jgi:hypothetical protein
VIWEPGADRPLSDEDRAKWESRIDRADHVRKQHEPTWDKALERYTASKIDKYDVNALLDFRHVETKKSQMFYQTPEVQLHPIDPEMGELPTLQMLPVRQKVLNHLLGPDGTNVKRTVHTALFDALAPAGVLVTEVGYDARYSVDPLTGARVVVWGKPFWERVSPKKLLIPDDFRSTAFDQAPWLGLKLTMPLTRAKREFQLPDDFTGTTRDDAVFEHQEQAGRQSGEPLVEYTKIWYQAEVFDATILNPELFRLLILVKGHTAVVTHMDSPFQSIDEMGQLMTDSMRGNPIHLGTLRDLSDSAYIGSDLAVGAQLSNELGKFRTGLIKNRVARTPITNIDPDGYDPETIEKIKNGEKVVFTKPGVLLSGQNPIQTSQVGTEPRDNYAAQDTIERDYQQALGQSDNRSGALAKQKRTATEVRAVETGASARSEAERDRLREWFIAGVRKFDTVIQRTITPFDLQRILGPSAAQAWELFRQVGGCYVYKVLPDSGVHVDAQQFRAQTLDEYNLLRKDPQINTAELLTTTTRALGKDPGKMVLPQAPEEGPEPIKFSMSIKGEDLIGPQQTAMIEILAQQGVQLSATAINELKAANLIAQMSLLQQPPDAQGRPAEHGGSADTTEPVNKHQTERTGGVQGVGVQ